MVEGISFSQMKYQNQNLKKIFVSLKNIFMNYLICQTLVARKICDVKSAVFIEAQFGAFCLMQVTKVDTEKLRMPLGFTRISASGIMEEFRMNLTSFLDSNL